MLHRQDCGILSRGFQLRPSCVKVRRAVCIASSLVCVRRGKLKTLRCLLAILENTIYGMLELMLEIQFIHWSYFYNSIDTVDEAKKRMDRRIVRYSTHMRCDVIKYTLLKSLCTYALIAERAWIVKESIVSIGNIPQMPHKVNLHYGQQIKGG